MCTAVGVLLALGVVCETVAFAQQEPQSPGTVAASPATYQTPALTLRVTTREVVVEVVATDRHNHPVSSLREDDFQIFELSGHSRKSLRNISAFRVIDPALANHDSELPSGGFQRTLEGGCAEKMNLHYELAYHPSADGWKSGYHEILVTTNRPETKLWFRQRYYVGSMDVSAKPQVSEANAESLLHEAACLHSVVPMSIALSARPLRAEKSNDLRYFITVQAESLAFITLSNETWRVGLDYGICTFDAGGTPLRYMHTSAEQVLKPEEYAQSLSQGFPTVIEFPRVGDPALARVVVRDRQTGNMGSIEVVISPLAAGELTSAEEEAAEKWKTKAARNLAIPPLGPIGSFGSILPRSGSLCGDVYELSQDSQQLPNFWDLAVIGELHAYMLNVPNQQFWNTGGIPGVTRRTEWFGIDYHGAFWVETPGNYEFELTSDDGAKLYIDEHLVVDLDGGHLARSKRGRIALDAGRHTIHVPYFEGPLGVALVLLVKPPGGQFELFDVRNFATPGGAAHPSPSTADAMAPGHGIASTAEDSTDESGHHGIAREEVLRLALDGSVEDAFYAGDLISDEGVRHRLPMARINRRVFRGAALKFLQRLKVNLQRHGVGGKSHTKTLLLSQVKSILCAASSRTISPGVCPGASITSSFRPPRSRI